MEFLKQGNPSAPPTTSKTVVSNPNPREETHVSNLDIVTNEKEEELRRLIPDLGPIDSKLLFTKADTKIDTIWNQAIMLNYETIEVNITT